MRYVVAVFTVALAVCSMPAHVTAQEEADQFPFDVLPAADRAELEQLAALPDAVLIDRLFGRAAPGQAPGLQKFYPPGTQVFPLSHGFAGPQEACIRSRSAAACRLHVQDLQAIQSAKQPPGLSNNPFGSTR